jgi:hypothetical protein
MLSVGVNRCRLWCVLRFLMVMKGERSQLMRKIFLISFFFAVHACVCTNFESALSKFQGSFDNIFESFLKNKDAQSDVLAARLTAFDQEVRAAFDQTIAQGLYKRFMVFAIRKHVSSDMLQDKPALLRVLSVADEILKKLSCDTSICADFIHHLKRNVEGADKKDGDVVLRSTLINCAMPDEGCEFRAVRPVLGSVSDESIVGSHSHLPGWSQAIQSAIDFALASLNKQGSLVLQKLMVREQAKFFGPLIVNSTAANNVPALLEHGMRMICGHVEADGTFSGEGFTCNRVSDGVYELTFDPAFSGTPYIVATTGVLTLGADQILLSIGASQRTPTKVTIKIGFLDFLFSCAFDFIAVGLA